MKGNPEIITMLNERLAEEHAAIVQYGTHERMCLHCGYIKLAAYLKERKESEFEHANELIDRILYLGGNPMFAEISEVFVEDKVMNQFVVDGKAELTAIAGYTEGINLCNVHSDFGTRLILEHILTEEEQHLHEVESHMERITQLGIETYLSTQVAG